MNERKVTMLIAFAFESPDKKIAPYRLDGDGWNPDSVSAHVVPSAVLRTRPVADYV